jgi:hypothetical protein
MLLTKSHTRSGTHSKLCAAWHAYEAVSGAIGMDTLLVRCTHTKLSRARKVLKCTKTTRGGTPSYVGLKLLVYEALSY